VASGPARSDPVGTEAPASLGTVGQDESSTPGGGVSSEPALVVPSGHAVGAVEGVIDTTYAAWLALCWSMITGNPIATSGLLAQVLERPGVVDEVHSSIDDSVAAHPVSDREEITAPGTSDGGWSMPFAIVDPRERIGMVLFAVLGLGALCFAIAGLPRRAYAAVSLSQENAFALRITLGFAGLILLAAAGIGQLAS
jgi:hypothetical protein